MGKSPNKKSRSHQFFGNKVNAKTKILASNLKTVNALQTGISYYQSKDYQKAQDCFQQAIKLEPRNSEAWYLLGATLTQLGDCLNAIKKLEHAIQLVPNEAKYHCHLGNAFHSQGEFEMAIACFQDALKLQPDSIDARFNLGNTFLKLLQFEEAVDAYQIVLKLDPKNVHAYNNLGHALQGLGEYEEAKIAFEQTIALDPNYLEGYIHIGNIFQLQEQYDEALTLYEKVLKEQPQNAGAYNNIANILKKQGRFQESVEVYEKALRLDPSDPALHLNIALILLLQGEFQRSWEEHEWRLKKSRVIPKELKNPIWQGQNIADQKLLLWGEQGFGDSLQFVRYAPLLQKEGYQVTIATRSPLINLFKQSFEPTINVIDQENADLSKYQHHNSLMGLPRLFQTRLETIPQNIPYLLPPSDIPKVLKLPKSKSLKIGLTWAGGKIGKELYESKSVRLDDFLHVQKEILKSRKISFWSLQVGEDATQIKQWLNNKTIFDVTPLLKDFLDTAAIIEQLDLIITVDTAVAHLAGAMGKPVWLLLPFVPDWRWLLDRDDSPWYPTVRLFRQPEIGNWQQVFLDIKVELQKLLKEGLKGLSDLQIKEQSILQKAIFPANFHNATFHYNSGKRFQLEGNFQAAIAEFQQAIEFQKDNPEIYNALGQSLYAIDDFSEAENAFKEAILIAPQNATLHYNLGNALLLQNKNEAAVIAYDNALKFNADSRDTWNNRGHALSRLGRHEEAIYSFQQILTFLPDDAYSYNHIGNILQEQADFEQAIAHFRQALILNPDNIEFKYNLANALKDLGAYSEAIDWYRSVLAVDPKHKNAHFNLGWVLLLTGNYQEGWQEHEWRFDPNDASDRLLPTPMWDGLIKRKQHLLLWSEQGLGDAIQFIRYLPLCHARNHRVTVATRPSLVKLFSECLGVEVDVINQEQIVDPKSYTTHISLMSLPKVFRTTEDTIPSTTPYIHAPEIIPAHLKLPTTKGKKIGIVWGSNAENTKLYQQKSVDLNVFLANYTPLLQSEKITFWSLQVGKDAATIQSWVDSQTIYDVSPLLKDFYDTASIIEQLDLVISIDTAVAHLAGAMGKPVWVMLPHVPDWRWLLEREDTPWYPTMQLFRQSEPGNWQDVFEEICEQLTAELLFEEFTPRVDQKSGLEISENPAEKAVFYLKLGDGLVDQERFAEAIAAYQNALEQEPNNPEIHNAFGNLYFKQQDFDTAIQYFQQAIALKPDSANLQFNLGNTYLAQQNYDEAIILYQKTIQLSPQHSGAYKNLSVALKAQKKYSEVIEVLEKFLLFAEDKVNIYNEIGNISYEQKDYQKAVSAFQAGLDLLENNLSLLYNLGNSFYELGELDAAKEAYQKILRENPTDVNAYFNYACSLQKEGNFTDAIVAFRAVLKIQPDHQGALCNLGFSLQENLQLEESLSVFQDVLKLNPEPGDHCNLAMALLRLNDFTNGWEGYDWRLKLFSPLNNFEIWQGQPIPKGETILLWSEQGLGDSLQFIRYASLIEHEYPNAKIVVATSKPLIRLFQECLISSVEVLDLKKDDLSHYKNHIPLMSLPRVFKTTEKTIPATVPYINSPSKIPPHLQLPPIGVQKIGLVWASGTNNKTYKARASQAKFFFEAFSDLLDSPLISFWSLQVGEDAPQIQPWLHHSNVIDVSPLLKDFLDTANIIQQLDLVITVDTAVAHLAGAMGKPVWIVLPFMSDWRWQNERDDSPWYPTARLFRQQTRGDWASTLQVVCHELNNKINQESNSSNSNALDISGNQSSKFYLALGNSFVEQGRTDEAIAIYSQALQLDSNSIDLLNQLAIIFYNRNDYDMAAQYFKQAIAIHKHDSNLNYNLGTIYLIQEKYDEAILSFQEVLRLNPQHSGACNNLSIALTNQKKYEEAIAILEHHLSFTDDQLSVYNQIANLYFQQQEYTKAGIYYSKVLEIDSHNIEAYADLSTAFFYDLNLDQAIKLCEKALELSPNEARIHVILGTVLLLKGDFKRGWVEHEWRCGSSPDSISILERQSVKEKEILIWGNHGFGDWIQFCRYTTLLREIGAQVTVAVKAPLARLFDEYLYSNIKVVNSDEIDVANYPLNIELLSLPKVFNTTEKSIPSITPYISVDKEMPKHLRLPNIGKTRIGIVWASDINNKATYQLRSSQATFFFEAFADLLDSPQVSFWSLQVGEDAVQIQPWLHHCNVIDVSPLLHDFHDTANVIHQLDLVITVDTAVAHLAGAMGKPVWILLPYSPCWRWQLDRHDSPWYPTARLFRQQLRGDWVSTLQRVRQELEHELNKDLSREALELNRTHVSEPIENNGYSFYLALSQSLTEKGKVEEAIAVYEDALQLGYQSTKILNDLGNLYQNKGVLVKAQDCFKKITEIDSQNIDAYFNLGNAYLLDQKHDQAIEVYQHILSLDPNHGGSYNNISIALSAEKRYEEALKYLEDFKKIEPNNANIPNQIGNILCDQKEYTKAIQYFQKALQKASDRVGILYNLGNAHQYAELYSEAVKYYAQVLELEPTNKSAQFNIGKALQDAGHLDEAILSYQKAIALDPDNAGAHLNLSLLFLLMANFEKGWEEYEWRFDPSKPEKKFLLTPMWDGQSITDELLIWYEQGMGDTLQFVRYVDIIQEQGIKITLSVPAPLVRLFQDCLDTSVTVVHQESPDFDPHQYKYHASLMSLPRIFKTRANTIPAKIPYIFPPSTCKSSLKLPSSSKTKIGIVWASGVANTGMYVHKSIDIDLLFQYLNPFIDQQQVLIWSLQVGQDAEQIQPWLNDHSVFDLSSLITDFHDTANIICQLDLIISVDTAVAHLAGAMGKPVWLMLPYRSDWRWQLNCEDSPWYPTIRLFRQTKHGDWEGVLEQMSKELNTIIFKENFPPQHQVIDIPINARYNGGKSIKTNQEKNIIMSESLKLHLGCGYKKLPGYINVDKFGDPDLRFDLETFPWPWEDNSVEEVVMHHVLEHLGQQTETYLKIIQELYRICKHEAVIDIRVPHHRSDNFIIDPTHVRIITSEGLSMFSKKANLEWKKVGAATTTLGLYLDVDFEVRSTVYGLSGTWNQKWSEKMITQEELNYAIRTYNNVIEEVHIKMVAIKSSD